MISNKGVIYIISIALMKKEDINTRENLSLLISTFYNKVREEPVLEPFFNNRIKN